MPIWIRNHDLLVHLYDIDAIVVLHKPDDAFDEFGLILEKRSRYWIRQQRQSFLNRLTRPCHIALIRHAVAPPQYGTASP